MDEHPSEALGLVRDAGRRDRFVLTDNLTGWLEAFTHSGFLGQGYMLRDEFVFEGWSSVVNGRTVDRDFKAVSDTVFPWGHRVNYPGMTEELLLHSGRRVLSLRVTTEIPSTLEIKPQWLSPFPKGLKRGSVVRQTPTTLTLHLVFGETPEEFRTNQDYAKQAGVWEAEVERRWATLTETWIITDDDDYNRAFFWAQASSRSLVVEEFGAGIWAGLPWFKDNWGRDTFIALPGTLLVTGQFAKARDVLANFGRYQNVDVHDRNEGRVPNRVTADEILYNTVDGTPWLIREILDYARCSGDLKFALEQRPLIRRYVDGALKNFVDADGLLVHDDADTWMDARIEGTTPWSPRGDRAVEIQVLWLTALEVGQTLAEYAQDGAEAQFYQEHAQRARESFLRLFVTDETLVDRLDGQGRPDTRVRPNVLLAVSIPFKPLLGEDVGKRVTAHTVSRLLLPQGILSLDPDHPDFHPRHEHPVYWHKDAAYHNGTIWGWNAGFAITALARCGWKDRAWQVAENLAAQILDLGTLGAMSELLDAVPDANGQLVPSGTFSQAWSTSEFVRNGWQDFLGFHPNLVDDELVFQPHLPTSWTHVRARAALGSGRFLDIEVQQTAREDGTVLQDWLWSGSASFPPVVIDQHRLEWSSTSLTCQRVVSPPESPPAWAEIGPSAGSHALSAANVLHRERRGTSLS